LKIELLRHRIFIFGILLLAISLPTSKFGMSLSQMILAANWLFDKRVLEKFKSFFTNKVALGFSLIFFVHLIWLANTSNFAYALDDLRTKSPILILAIIFSTTPIISAKEFRNVLLAHLFSVLLTSLISFYIYITQHPTDFRLISPFISHIRLALHVCIAVFTLIYFLAYNSMVSIRNKKELFALRIVYIGLIIWFVNFLSVLQSVTGIALLLILTIAVLIRFVTKSPIHRFIKIGVFTFVIIFPIAIGGYLYHMFSDYIAKPKVDFSTLDKMTIHGGEYRHDTTNFITENQRWIGLYFCESEVAYAWNLRSSLKWNAKDSQGNIINYTIIRYLNSKDLRKDFEGVNALTAKDVENIEQGIANVNYTKGLGIEARLYKLFWEYIISSNNGAVKGHSMSQRVELWENSIALIRNNWVTGVGTGDLPDAFKNQLIADDSPLKETRMRSHNQYFSLFIAFGFFGFLLSFFSFIYPFIKTKQLFDYFCMIFLIVFFVSMLTEDTIESQDGVTLYAFFATLYLFQKPISNKMLKIKWGYEKNKTV